MTPNRRHRLERYRRRRNPLGRVLAIGGGSLGLVAFIGAGFAVNAARKDVPDLDQIKQVALGENSRVFDRSGKRLAIIPRTTNRTEVRYAEIPVALRNGTVAIEDKRFWKHHGVDWNRVVSAAVHDIRSGSTRQGGSTITMQVAKNLYSDRTALLKRNFEQKIRETSLAIQIEKRFTKEQILAKYLNGVSYGGNAIGVEAASLTYFSKHVSELNLAQSALLAGLPQAPSDYNPFRHRDAARARRNEVLDKMVEQKMITAEDAASAKVSGLQLKRGTAYTQAKQPYFVNYVRKQLEKRFGRRRTLRGGFRVYTTIDPKMQQWAEEAMNSNLDQPDDPEAAIVLIDAKSGYIRAMASKRPYSKASQYNYAADAKRQPGSTFKTIALTQAIIDGINPDTTIYVSHPLSINDPKYGPPFKTKTYDGSSRGPISLYRATLTSDNTVYMQLGLDLGPARIAALGERMGVEQDLKGFPSIVLGGQEVTPVDMAVAYSPLANGGLQIVPTAIRDIAGSGIKRNPFVRKPRRIFKDGVAYEVTRVLRANVQGGTGTAANIGYPAAGKTGTTEEFTDAWFVGYTPHYVAAVWIGYPNNDGVKRTLRGLRGGGNGGNFPARIWHDFMIKVAATDGQLDFTAPSNPVTWQKFTSDFTKAAYAAQQAAASSAASVSEATKTATKPDKGPGTGTAPVAPPSAPPASPDPAPAPAAPATTDAAPAPPPPVVTEPVTTPPAPPPPPDAVITP